MCVHFDYSCILWQALRLTPFLAAINNAEMNPRCKWSLDPDSILCGCAPRRGPGCGRAFGVRRVLYTLHFFHSQKVQRSCVCEGSEAVQGYVLSTDPFSPFTPKQKSGDGRHTATAAILGETWLPPYSKMASTFLVLRWLPHFLTNKKDEDTA